jgi:hypothetical protein
MAKTKRKRQRKHRGTPAGTVERAAHNTRGRAQARASKPRTKEEQRADSRRRREERMLREPTWRGTLNRAAIAAAVLFGLAVFMLDRTVEQAAILALFSLALYIPLGYLLDRAMYQRALKRKQRGQTAASGAAGSREHARRGS